MIDGSMIVYLMINPACDQVLKCLLQLVQNFPSLLKAQFSSNYTPFILSLISVVPFKWFYGLYVNCPWSWQLNFGPVIVAPLWQMVVSSLKVYQLAAIQGSEDPHSGTYDSDGAEKSLESFVIQVEFSYEMQLVFCVSCIWTIPDFSSVAHHL